jgi:hypothetical protein
MEIVYFIMFVAACAMLLLWATRKSGRRRKDHALLREQARLKKQQADLLSTPSSYLLANRSEVWAKKRQNGAEDVIVTNRFVPKSVSAGEPEYDGFSRRDRHHVVVGTAYIKKEDHVDEAVKPAAGHKEGSASG